jgi:hypothetical protein
MASYRDSYDDDDEVSDDAAVCSAICDVERRSQDIEVLRLAVELQAANLPNTLAALDTTFFHLLGLLETARDRACDNTPERG